MCSVMKMTHSDYSFRINRKISKIGTIVSHMRSNLEPFFLKGPKGGNPSRKQKLGKHFLFTFGMLGIPRALIVITISMLVLHKYFYITFEKKIQGILLVIDI